MHRDSCGLDHSPAAPTSGSTSTRCMQRPRKWTCCLCLVLGVTTLRGGGWVRRLCSSKGRALAWNLPPMALGHQGGWEP